ncbi:MAG: SMC-Scp complex subunit ScpB [Cyclobacteriaceae bacterium]
MDYLVNHIEALIFCSQKPIRTEELKNCLTEMFEADVPIEDIEQAIGLLEEKYKKDEYSFEPIRSGGGYQFLTKPAYQSSISILLKQQSKKRLSNSSLETLAIVAYKQPVTKAEVEQVRGVNCDYAMHKLLEKELIEIRGKAETVGRPTIYGTSSVFMDYFGINDLKDLPSPKEFTDVENSIGENKE